MCSKQSRRFKSKSFQHNYRKKIIEKNQQSTYHANANVNLMVKSVIQSKIGITANIDVRVGI